MRRKLLSLLGLAALALPLFAAPPKSDKTAILTNEPWKGVSSSPLKPGEIDELVAKAQKEAKVTPSPKTTDEQFIRRVMLDLTGRLPLPADVTEFSADNDPNKRAKL